MELDARDRRLIEKVRKRSRWYQWTQAFMICIAAVTFVAAVAIGFRLRTQMNEVDMQFSDLFSGQISSQTKQYMANEENYLEGPVVLLEIYMLITHCVKNMLFSVFALLAFFLLRRNRSENQLLLKLADSKQA